MRIGELAAATGVSPRALRYYEEQDLLGSERTSGGQREYGPDAQERVQLIQLLLRSGLTSRSVLELMPCLVTGAISTAQHRLLEREHQRISEQIDQLAGARDRLEHLMQTATVVDVA